MAILALPLVTSILKPHKHNLSLIFTKPTASPFTLRQRLFFRRTIASAVSTDSSVSQESSMDPASSEQPKKSSVPTFQQAIQRLQEYWASVGCAVMQCSNTEVGAGTMNPLTFLRVLGPEPWNVASMTRLLKY